MASTRGSPHNSQFPSLPGWTGPRRTPTATGTLLHQCMGSRCKGFGQMGWVIFIMADLETKVALGCLRLPLIFSRISQWRDKNLQGWSK